MSPRGSLPCALAALAALGVMACGARHEQVAPPRPSATEPVVPRQARVAAPPPDRYAPSAASVRDGAVLPPDMLTAIDRCSICHADVFAQWSSSAHRMASLDNPFYLPAFLATRQQRGPLASRFCAGCHDPALLFPGDVDGPPIDRTHERAQLGVGCVLCHSIERLHDRTGNGNYVLSPDPIPVPPRERAPQAAIDRHRARVMRPLLHQSDFCGGCHKVGLTEAVNEYQWLRGQDDLDSWDQSAWAGNAVERYDPDVPRRTCQECHMPLEPATRGDLAATRGMIHSHRFLGGHTALAAWRNDPEHLARERSILQNAIRIDLFRAPDSDRSEPAAPLEEATLAPGRDVAFDVVLVNERVGHVFPTGTADVADIWVEVTVTDARGRRLAESGALRDRDPGSRNDDSHRLEVAPLDDTGAPSLLRDPHRYRAVGYNTTLPPREARVVRYTWRVPSDVQGPLTVRARLLHRRLANPYWTFACAQAPRDQGRACPAPPVTEVASVQVVTGGEVTPALGGANARWRRFYDHGRAIAEASLQEHVGQARGSLQTVVSLVPDRAEGYVELARVAMREGRTEEAYGFLDEAARRDPSAPVVPYLRAAAAGDVWRWGETVAPLTVVHALVPRNVLATEMLANGLGLANRHEEALRVIFEGLAVDPERAQLHHLQALELEALGAHDEAARAHAAYLRHRVHDESPGLRARCKRDVPNCAREAIPLHAHPLHAPGERPRATPEDGLIPTG